MNHARVEIVIGSLGKAGQRITAARTARFHGQEVENWLETLRINSQTRGPAYIPVIDRYTKATHIVNAKKIVAVIVHGGTTEEEA